MGCMVVKRAGQVVKRARWVAGLVCKGLGLEPSSGWGLRMGCMVVKRVGQVVKRARWVAGLV